MCYSQSEIAICSAVQRKRLDSNCVFYATRSGYLMAWLWLPEQAPAARENVGASSTLGYSFRSQTRGAAAGRWEGPTSSPQACGPFSAAPYSRFEALGTPAAACRGVESVRSSLLTSKPCAVYKQPVLRMLISSYMAPYRGGSWGSKEYWGCRHTTNTKGGHLSKRNIPICSHPSSQDGSCNAFLSYPAPPGNGRRAESDYFQCMDSLAIHLNFHLRSR
ncbi:hypothetical protein L211DRAFT_848148 [Terfezia boudieri ATCC MYA-4762]|uniref:Uncharacterized protein n=1 Tax=Terfezia boudieri ATCC MYA-4762 TaxID=1051890 RepID=A0A3N4LQU9_9PEZI|nr:hypothetical protein L211DRAFT_848148 [Terfezia boudieri ATCC MYA-4762]